MSWIGTSVVLGLLLASPAQAAPQLGWEPPDRNAPEREPFRFGLRGLVETWADDAIATVYRSGAVTGGVAVVAPVWGPVAVELEAGYRRLKPHSLETDAAGSTAADDGRLFQLAPITLLVEGAWSPPKTPLSLYGGLGPALVVFHERFPTGSLPDESGIGSRSGVKMGVELRVGGRVDTGLVQARMAPGNPLRSIELEIFGAKRIHSGKKGFDLNAWRGGLGLLFGF